MLTIVRLVHCHHDKPATVRRVVLAIIRGVMLMSERGNVNYCPTLSLSPR